MSDSSGQSDHALIAKIEERVEQQSGQIGMMNNAVTELAKNVNTLVQTVERNTASNHHLGEKVDKMDDRFEKRMEKDDDRFADLYDIVGRVQSAQAVNKTKWAITAAISVAILSGLISLFVFIVRPLVSVDSASGQNAEMIDRLTTIVERLEVRQDE